MAGSYAPRPTVSTELDDWLGGHLAADPGSACVTVAQAAVMVHRQAVSLDSPSQALIVNEAGALDARRPTCAQASIDPGGGTDVALWEVPQS